MAPVVTSIAQRNPNERMEAFKQVLESGVFNHALLVNRQAIFDAWAKSDPEEPVAREKLYMALQAMDAVRDRMYREYRSAKNEIDVEAFRKELE